MQHSLLITEIYRSVQGEASYSGWPCTFVRLTGCPLRCRWCDTAYGFKGGSEWTFTEILSEIERLGVPLVELTGGEPLAQPAVVELINLLQKNHYRVMIETSGSESIAKLSSETHIIMDIKCPGSGMKDMNRFDNLAYLKPTDDIKFVIADREDFDWARDYVLSHRLDEKFQILFSCAFGLLQPQELVEWILDAKLFRVRLNLQQHKYIWHPRKKGV